MHVDSYQQWTLHQLLCFPVPVSLYIERGKYDLLWIVILAIEKKKKSKMLEKPYDRLLRPKFKIASAFLSFYFLS